jgi:hypothetical protein
VATIRLNSTGAVTGDFVGGPTSPMTLEKPRRYEQHPARQRLF